MQRIIKIRKYHEIVLLDNQRISMVFHCFERLWFWFSRDARDLSKQAASHNAHRVLVLSKGRHDGTNA